MSTVTSSSSVTARRQDKGAKRFSVGGGTPPATRVAAWPASRPAYPPRRPTETVLYRAVHETLETFLAHARETYAAPLPRYVERELRGYMGCGVFAHGFTRCHCDA